MAMAIEQSVERQGILSKEKEMARQHLIDRQRERRAVELAKERQLEEFTLEQNRKEQAEADEMGVRVRNQQKMQLAVEAVDQRVL